MNKYSEFYGSFDQLFSKEISYTDLTDSKTFPENFEQIIKEA